jgi:hypothetical protein
LYGRLSAVGSLQNEEWERTCQAVVLTRDIAEIVVVHMAAEQSPLKKWGRNQELHHQAGPQACETGANLPERRMQVLCCGAWQCAIVCPRRLIGPHWWGLSVAHAGSLRNFDGLSMK